MKYLALLLLFGSTSSFGQNIDTLGHWTSYDDSIVQASLSMPTVQTIREDIFKRNYSQIIKGIDEGVFPSNLSNPCLDQDNPTYCYRGSHSFRSLRHDLIDAIPCLYLKNLNDILLKGHETNINQVCQESQSGEQSYKTVTTFRIIAEALNARCHESMRVRPSKPQ